MIKKQEDIHRNPKKLRMMAIQNKRRGMITKGVCLLHENAHSHTTNATIKQLSDSFGWDIPPTALTWHFQIFISLPLSSCLWVEKAPEKPSSKQQCERLCDKGIRKLILRLTKCIEKEGDYVE